jgi:hypothetical protein
MVYQQHDGVFIVYLLLLLLQDGVDPPHKRAATVFLQ